MKFDCDIIKDLLPLYSEDVCTEKSKLVVDEHLRECASCTETLNTMKSEISVKNDYSDKEVLKKIKKGIKKEKYKTIKLSILISFFVVLAIGWFSAKYVLVQSIKEENNKLPKKSGVIKIENTVQGTESITGLHYSVPDGMNKEINGASVKYTNTGNNSLIIINYRLLGDCEDRISSNTNFFTHDRVQNYMAKHNLNNYSELSWYCFNYDAQDLSVFSNILTLKEAVFAWLFTRDFSLENGTIYKIEAESFDGIFFLSDHDTSVNYFGTFEKGAFGGDIVIAGRKDNISIDDIKYVLSSFSFDN